MKKFIGEGLKCSGPNRNVLNILRLLVEDEDCTVYVPYNYVRGSNNYVPSGDPRVHFYPAESGRPARVMSLKSNSERYNFSIVCLVDVLVEYYEDDKVELRQKKVWRTYNVVRDGELSIDKVSAKLSESAFESLRDADLLYYNGVKVGHNHSYVKDFTYIIKFDDVPIVSLNWAQPERIGLCDLILKDTDLSEKLKVLRKIRNDFPKPQYDDAESDIYSETVEYVKNEDKETKQVDCLVYRIPEYKVKYTAEEIDNVKNSYGSYEEISKDIKSMESQLSRVRFMYRSVIYSIESTKLKGSFGWGEEEKLPRSKDKMVKRAEISNSAGNKYIIERLSYKKSV